MFEFEQICKKNLSRGKAWEGWQGQGRGVKCKYGVQGSNVQLGPFESHLKKREEGLRKRRGRNWRSWGAPFLYIPTSPATQSVSNKSLFWPQKKALLWMYFWLQGMEAKIKLLRGLVIKMFSKPAADQTASNRNSSICTRRVRAHWFTVSR